MKNSFFTQWILLSVICVAGVVVIRFTDVPGSLIDFSGFCLLVVSLTTLLAYRIAAGGMKHKSRPQAFVNRFLLSFIAKFFLCAGAMGAWFALVEANKMMLVPFALLYILYTSLEVASLLRVNKR